MITQERLKELVKYEPETGQMTWRVNKARGAKVGGRVGSIQAFGYLETKIDGVCYRVHRLAWFYYYGDWPRAEIDHIDGNRTNNVISNLREATRAQNCQNKSRSSLSKIGVKGVGFHNGAYRARINVNNKQIYLGHFKTIEEAHEAYCKAARELHGEFARVA